MNSATFSEASWWPQADAAVKTDFDRALESYRWVAGAIVLSLVWKASYYPLAFGLYRDLQLKDEFFPALFRSAEFLAVLVAVPLLLGLVVLLARRVWLFKLHGVATASCMAALCWHQGSYNDVTFFTCFWASLWCVWLSHSLHQPSEILLPKAGRFALLIVCLMFLGGAVGKYTPGYWSGEVLYQIYFVDRDFWFFNLLRGWLEGESLRTFATAYSRFVVIAETVGAFFWLLPLRIGGSLALITFLGIISLSNFNLFSVMFCMLGLCAIAIKSHRPTVIPTSST